MNQREVLTRATNVNGFSLAVYMSYTSQNFCLLHVSNLSILKFRLFSARVSGDGDGRLSAAARQSAITDSLPSALSAAGRGGRRHRDVRGGLSRRTRPYCLIGIPIGDRPGYRRSACPTQGIAAPDSDSLKLRHWITLDV